MTNATFSIPNRIEPSATRESNEGSVPGKRLSVSPIGSSPLQRRRNNRTLLSSPSFSIPNRIEPSATRYAVLAWPIATTFSIPNRIEPSATGIADGVWRAVRRAFSIPNRIEPSATRVGQPTSMRDDAFQYPQSDRALCNWTRHFTPVAGLVLSVSPIGSSPLQLPGASANDVLRVIFQYPQSDRALCNFLSTHQSFVLIKPFSIPNRIEPSATVQAARRCSAFPSAFSIPNRIEPSATVSPWKYRSITGTFQYPQSDRALCNARRSAPPPATSWLSVSPIGSSPLQPGRVPTVTRTVPVFQYPQSDRALCN